MAIIKIGASFISSKTFPPETKYIDITIAEIKIAVLKFG